jgi:hypothetical protein
MLKDKRCTKCGVVKPSASFRKRPEVKSGLASWCRKCTDDHINNNWTPRVRRKRKKETIALLGGCCKTCGGIFPWYVYDFHHRNPDEKELNMTDLQDKKWCRIQEEISKCDLLCANCHRIAHHAGKE